MSIVTTLPCTLQGHEQRADDVSACTQRSEEFREQRTTQVKSTPGPRERVQSTLRPRKDTNMQIMRQQR